MFQINYEYLPPRYGLLKHNYFNLTRRRQFREIDVKTVALRELGKLRVGAHFCFQGENYGKLPDLKIKIRSLTLAGLIHVYRKLYLLKVYL